jgi:flagellar protein FliS
MLYNPAKTYKTISLQTANQLELVVRMYEGAIRFLELAKLGFEQTDPVERIQTIHNNVMRSMEIINELNLTLDMERGGETAIQLRDLYNYFENRLFDSNMRKDMTGIQEVIDRLGSLLEAWEEIGEEQSALAVS